MDETERFWAEWRKEADERFGKAGERRTPIQYLESIELRLERIEAFFERLVELDRSRH